MADIGGLPRKLIDDIRLMRAGADLRGGQVVPWPDLRFRLAQAGWHFTVEELQRICDPAGAGRAAPAGSECGPSGTR